MIKRKYTEKVFHELPGSPNDNVHGYRLNHKRNPKSAPFSRLPDFASKKYMWERRKSFRRLQRKDERRVVGGGAEGHRDRAAVPQAYACHWGRRGRIAGKPLRYAFAWLYARTGSIPPPFMGLRRYIMYTVQLHHQNGTTANKSKKIIKSNYILEVIWRWCHHYHRPPGQNMACQSKSINIHFQQKHQKITYHRCL